MHFSLASGLREGPASWFAHAGIFIRNFGRLLVKQWAEKKCPPPFAGNRPFGCFAQKGSDTFFSHAPKP